MNNKIVKGAQNILWLGVLCAIVLSIREGYDLYKTYADYGNPDIWMILNVIFNLIKNVSILYGIDVLLEKVLNIYEVYISIHNEINTLNVRIDRLHNEIIYRSNAEL
ncbi:MAG: hypothetical protein IJ054_08520, partial [Lachnospiraceae bacterium]|nr:hypothetical protein [Lachnospiraceae bacterium]